MPYIDQDRQLQLANEGSLDCDEIGSPGELTFALAYVCDRVLRNSEERFADFAVVLGSLEATKLELYRRLVGPYEDTKIAEDTDVFDR